MRCSKTFELLSRKLDRDLTQRERQKLFEHVRSCPKCRDLQAKVESDSLDLKRVLHFSKPDLRSFVARAMAYITEMEEPHGSGTTVRRRTVRWTTVLPTAGLAASILALAYLVFVHDSIRVERILELEDRLALAPVSEPEPPAKIEEAAPRSLEASPVEAPDLETPAGNAAPAARSESPEPDEPGVEPGTDLPITGAEIEEVLDQLLAAIDERDRGEIERLLPSLLKFWEATDHISERLMGFYLDENDPLKREEIVKVMSQFTVGTHQDFFLEQLKNVTSVPLRRALTAGIVSTLESGQEALPYAADRLWAILRSRNEDFEVRANAANALLMEAVVRDDLGTIDSIRQAVFDGEAVDPRLAQRVAAALAGQIDRTSDPFIQDELVRLLAPHLEEGGDYGIANSIVSQLEQSLARSPDPEAVRRVVNKMSRRSSEEMRNRLHRVREMFGSGDDRRVEDH